MTKKYIQYSDIIGKFYEALAELDARYQDGTIAPKEEIGQLGVIADHIEGYADSMQNDNAFRADNSFRRGIV